MKKETLKKRVFKLLQITVCIILITSTIGGCKSNTDNQTDTNVDGTNSDGTNVDGTNSDGTVVDGTSVDSENIELLEATGPNLDYISADGKYYTDYPTLEDEQIAAKKLSIEIAQEGDVLLKNAGSILPLSKDVEFVTLFGMHSINLVPSGGGSAQGNLGNNGIEPSTVKSALEEAGYTVNPKTLTLYATHQALGTTRNELPIEYYNNAVVGTYGGYGDAAVITISRMGSENADLLTNNAIDHANVDEHALQLDDNEVALIKHVKEYFDKVIVLINSSNVMQIPELAENKTDDNLGVDAIIWVGNTGNNAIDAVGSILNGTTNPSGHTVDMWPVDFTKDPTFTNFSANSQNKNSDGSRMDSFLYYDGKDTGYRTVEYREGIYMGYRYYETMAADMNTASSGSGDSWYNANVLYPFGYGLSYTTFDWSLGTNTPENGIISAANQVLSIDVTIKNTGDYAGKDVAQIYIEAPYTAGGIEKATANLVGFAKTDMLQPGESQTVTVTFVAQDMASFDYNDANDNDFEGYELEKGDYYITARHDSHDVAFSVTRTIESDILCETDYTTGAEIKPVFVDDYTTVNDSLENNEVSRDNLQQPTPSTKEDRTITEDVKDRLDSQETYASYQDDPTDPWYVGSSIDGWTQAKEHQEDYSDVSTKLSEMSGITYTLPTIENGVVTLASDDNSKAWDAFMNQLTWEEMVSLVVDGGGSVAIDSIEKAPAKAQDGSCQISGGTLWASTPILSATYNVDLAKEQGRMIGNESIFGGVDGWYGPSLDIHRSPFSGRNFEYYSQDGVQGGIMAAALIEGATSKGVICFTKHVFLNDQEAYRGDQGGVLVMANEQAIREIYAKNFEYAFKAGSMGFMSAFNRIGYVQSSHNYAMHQTLIRDEWGFTGYSVTDAWIRAWSPLDLMVRAGDEEVLGSGSNAPEYNLETGVWDPTNNTVLVKGSPSATTETMESNTHYYAVRRAAQRILYTVSNANANNNGISPGENTDIYMEMGVVNSVPISMSSSDDLVISLPEESVMPDGLILDNVVVKGTPLEEGDYTVALNVLADGWVSTSANLNIHVGSAMYLDGEQIIGDTVATIAAGQEYSGVFDFPYFKYHNLVEHQAGWASQVRIINWYLDDIGRPVVANEDKTAADITTIDPSDAAESHIYGYSYEGNIPDGMTFENVMDSFTGTSGTGTYDAAVGYKLTGTPTSPGTYKFTVTVTAPYVAHVNVWDQPNWGRGELTYSREVTIVVE